MSKKYSNDEENGVLELEINEGENLSCENTEDNEILFEPVYTKSMEQFLINVFEFAIEAVKAYSKEQSGVSSSQDKQSVEMNKEQGYLIKDNSLNNNSVNVWVYNNTVVDFSNFVATVNGEVVNLGVVPIRVLKILVENKGKTLTRGQILSQLWGNDKELFDRTIDSHISILNRTLGLRNCIKSVRGIGYRID